MILLSAESSGHRYVIEILPLDGFGYDMRLGPAGKRRLNDGPHHLSKVRRGDYVHVDKEQCNESAEWLDRGRWPLPLPNRYTCHYLAISRMIINDG